MNNESARLEIIHQGRVAQIVFRDGSQSQLLVTKSQALEIGEALVGIKMNKHEWARIREEIYRSFLITKDSGLEDFCNKMQGENSFFERQLKAFRDQMWSDDDEGEEWKRQ